MAGITTSMTVAPLRAGTALYRAVVPHPLRTRLWFWRHGYGFTVQPAQRILAVSRIGASAAEQRGLSHFERALAEHFKHADRGHPMLETWVSYAWGTNTRGRDTVRTIRKYTTVEGKRHLDIGSAYGGTSIAFAQAGAVSQGVEIDSQLLHLAQANLADHPRARCTFFEGDILDPAVAARVGRVDIITCEHVIEHVASARQLVDVMRSILSADGLCHLWIPNAFSYSQVRRDGHYGLFGLTLLDRDDAIEYFRAAGNAGDYGVGEYCFTFDEYAHIFRSAGLRLEWLDPLPAEQRSVEALQRDMASLADAYRDAVAADRIPPRVAPLVEARLQRYLSAYEAAYRQYLDAAPPEQVSRGAMLLRDYRVDAWQVIARPISSSE